MSEPTKTTELTFEEMEVELSNAAYQAGLWFELAEEKGYIWGNGHHMAQQLADFAVAMLKDPKRRRA